MTNPLIDNTGINVGQNTFLQCSNNLSDLQSASTGYANLVGSLITTVAASAGVINLDGTYWGQTVLCTGVAGTTTINLTVNTAAKTITIQNNTVATKMVVTPGSGKINGFNTVSLGYGDAITLRADGTNFWITNQSLQMVSASVYKTADQTVAAGSAVLVNLDTVVWDTGGYFNTTSHAYTPAMPGLYLINASSDLSTGLAGAVATFQGIINKNGTAAATYKQQGILVGGEQAVSLSTLASLNGSTDNVSFSIIQNSLLSPSLSLKGGITLTYMTINRVALLTT